MLVNHRAEGCQARPGPSLALGARRAERDGDAGPVGAAASSAAQPVVLDASQLHVPQTVILQHQVVMALEEVAVTWDEREEAVSTPGLLALEGSWELGKPRALGEQRLTRRGPSEAGKGTWLWESALGVVFKRGTEIL